MPIELDPIMIWPLRIGSSDSRLPKLRRGTYCVKGGGRTIFLGLVVCVFWISTNAFTANAGQLFGAERYINDLGEKVLVLLKDKERPDAQKRRDIEELLEKEVDFKLASVFVLGPHWDRIPPKKRSKYQKLFQEYEIANLSDRLLRYPVETFHISKAEPKGKADVLVHTIIIHSDPNREPLEPAWRVRTDNGRYKIIDLHYKGTSLAISKRSDFKAVLEDENRGIDWLMQDLRDKLLRISK